jgi:hypothetical protein
LTQPIKLVSPKDADDVVETLKELLERAEQGEFNAVVCVGLRSDLTFEVVSSDVRNVLELIGALAIAQHDALLRAQED